MPILPWPAGWPRSVAQARAPQTELAGRVETTDRLGEVRLVAGVDVHYPRGRGVARAAAVLHTLPGLEPVESVMVEMEAGFPYVSGYLSFREVPPAAVALARLTARPDLVICDGQGTAHPRRAGLACHLGVYLDLPAIGVAKSRLVGEYDPPGQERGQWSPLVHAGQTVGAVLRTRAGVKPVFVSPGHRVGLATAISLTLAAAPCFRLPETTRRAHRLAGGT